jgi:hypothetical protein
LANDIWPGFHNHSNIRGFTQTLHISQFQFLKSSHLSPLQCLLQCTVQNKYKQFTLAPHFLLLQALEPNRTELVGSSHQLNETKSDLCPPILYHLCYTQSCTLNKLHYLPFNNINTDTSNSQHITKIVHTNEPMRPMKMNYATLYTIIHITQRRHYKKIYQWAITNAIRHFFPSSSCSQISLTAQ